MVRDCDVCGQSDDHPRHVHMDGETARIRHMDCCASQGCDTCTLTEAVTDGKRGSDLLEAILAGAFDGIEV